MEKRHRDLIDEHCDKMVPNLRIHEIWPKLFQHDIFKPNDINISRWKDNLDNQEIVKDILLTIKTRGPYAFPKLISILKNTGHNDQANLLEKRLPNIPANIISLNVSPILSSLPSINTNNNLLESSAQNNEDFIDNNEKKDYNNDKFNLQVEPLPLKVKVDYGVKSFNNSDHSSEPVYQMSSEPRGLVLIITLIEYKHEPVRESAGHDEKNLRDLFQQMGFITICKSELSGQQIRDEVKKFAQNQDFYHVDSSFVIISAHGHRCEEKKQSYIVGIDGDVVYWSEIISYFSSEKCEALKGKPKVFIFQTCRGKNEQKVLEGTYVQPNSMDNSSDIFYDEPEFNHPGCDYRDILVASSTMPGYVSFRDRCTGSWFITMLCDVFMKHAKKYDIKDLFAMVDNGIATLRSEKEKCQTTTVRTVFFCKRLYLHPVSFPNCIVSD